MGVPTHRQPGSGGAGPQPSTALRRDARSEVSPATTSTRGSPTQGPPVELARLSGEAPDAVAGLQEARDEPAPDVAGGAGDENGLDGRGKAHAAT